MDTQTAQRGLLKILDWSIAQHVADRMAVLESHADNCDAEDGCMAVIVFRSKMLANMTQVG